MKYYVHFEIISHLIFWYMVYLQLALVIRCTHYTICLMVHPRIVYSSHLKYKRCNQSKLHFWKHRQMQMWWSHTLLEVQINTIRHVSYIIRHVSYIIRHVSYVIRHLSYSAFIQCILNTLLNHMFHIILSDNNLEYKEHWSKPTYT